MKTLTKNISIIEQHGKSVFWSLTGLLLLVVSLYVYLVNTAAMNGVRWGHVQQETAELEARLSELEAKYLSLKQSVTLASAYENGFQDVTEVTFINTHKVGIVAKSSEL